MTIYYRTIEKGHRDSSFWRLAEQAVQSNPIDYNLVLPYKCRGGKWLSVTHKSASDIRNFMPLANGGDLGSLGGVVSASNKALEKLYGQLEQSEALVVAWKERQKTLDLVTTNIRRLVTIARAVRRRDPKIVRRVLKRNPKAKDIIKTPSGLWLEYHFAIAPTIQDIHHALTIFSYEFPVQKLAATSMVVTRRLEMEGTYGWYRDYNYKTYVKLTGEVYGVNPNIGLASRLGFGQPLSVAWETTPFSWFIDYFVNVGQLVKNLEPRFPSIETRNHSTTTLIKGNGFLGYEVAKNTIKYNSFESFHMNRKRGWPSFKLEFISPLSLKGQQCSYIAAVLGSILTSMKRKS